MIWYICLQFLTLPESVERARLLPVLTTILKLSQEEVEKVQSVVTGTALLSKTLMLTRVSLVILLNIFASTNNVYETIFFARLGFLKCLSEFFGGRNDQISYVYWTECPTGGSFLPVIMFWPEKFACSDYHQKFGRAPLLCYIVQESGFPTLPGL